MTSLVTWRRVETASSLINIEVTTDEGRRKKKLQQFHYNNYQSDYAQ